MKKLKKKSKNNISATFQISKQFLSPTKKVTCGLCQKFVINRLTNRLTNQFLDLPSQLKIFKYNQV